MLQPSSQSRLFCFTHYGDEPIQRPGELVQWIGWGRETCPTTGRTHYQGAVYLSKKSTVTAVRKLFTGDHVELCKGDFEHNLAYITKEGELVEHGERPRPGERLDLSGAVRAIVEGRTSVDQIVIDNPTLHARAARTLDRAEEICSRKRRRTEQTTICWIYGPTGTGKSHKVHTDAPEAYIKPLGDKDVGWWDNYNGEEDVWLDDFRGQIPYAELLTLADKWPKTVSRRCRPPVPFMAKRIWITSPLPPEGVYKRQVDKEDSIEQLKRRISQQIHMTERFIVDLTAEL
ncbi:replication associated protein [Chifec virus UA13_111]|nr:replication associated protein [Chifec virus UA13_111]